MQPWTLIAMVLVLAQAIPTPADPSGAGWIAAVTTAGLLGPVLYWLCYVHLPAKDRQIEKVIADHATERKEESEKAATVLTAVMAKHEAELQKIHADCADERTIIRQDNHARYDSMNQQALKQSLDFVTALKEIESRYREAAREDRAEHSKRNLLIETAIKEQTGIITDALTTALLNSEKKV